MRNWSTNTTKFKKSKDEFAIWQIEQLVNFGLGKKRIKKSKLKKYWNTINIDPFKRKFLSLFIK